MFGDPFTLIDGILWILADLLDLVDWLLASVGFFVGIFDLDGKHCKISQVTPIFWREGHT